uniref:Uncharacterized protein n=1 Tax=Arion vulgaris TaxID=1028688 RepID=A0A0B7BKL3_9EUPU
MAWKKVNNRLTTLLTVSCEVHDCLCQPSRAREKVFHILFHESDVSDVCGL